MVRNFTDPGDSAVNTFLCRTFRGYLSSVMGRAYTSAEVLDKRGLNFQQCDFNDSPYTAFNMGSGEASVIALMYALQRSPRGGILVVDEIEAGLHPHAQRRLAETLIEVCLSKQMQIVCSTHSEFFLDALPRVARLVVKSSPAGGHTVLEDPSTRYAMYEMDGRCKPELTVYCEDTAAQEMLRAAFGHDLLIRLNIVPVGSDATVIRQGVSHIRSGFDMRCICVLDGDVKKVQVEKWIKSELGERDDISLNYLILPGDDLPPEKWIIKQLLHSAYVEKFLARFQCSEDNAVAHIQAMNVEADHHSIGYILGQRVNLPEKACLSKIMEAVAPYHPQLDHVKNTLQELID